MGKDHQDADGKIGFAGAMSRLPKGLLEPHRDKATGKRSNAPEDWNMVEFRPSAAATTPVGRGKAIGFVGPDCECEILFSYFLVID